MADFVLEGGISKDYYTDNSENQTPSPKTSGVVGNLEYVKMLNNPRLTVKITTPKRGIITSALSSDFGFSLGNNWSPLVPLSSLPLIANIEQGVPGVLAAAVGATQFSFESLWMTSASWSGSKMPTFPVRLAFLNYTKQADVIYQMLAIAEGALTPDRSYDTSQAGYLADFFSGASQLISDTILGASDISSNIAVYAQRFSKVENPIDFAKTVFRKDTMEENFKKHNLTQKIANTLTKTTHWTVAAPCNYGLNIDTTASGTIFSPKAETTFALQIGNWFEANNLLIQDVNISFSKEITPEGNPLILYVDVTFRPYRNISFKEFRSYFKLTNFEAKSAGSSLGGSVGKTLGAKIGGNA